MIQFGVTLNKYSMRWCNQNQITNELVNGVSVLDEITCLDRPPQSYHKRIALIARSDGVLSNFDTIELLIYVI
jgi:hypothetical protein